MPATLTAIVLSGLIFAQGEKSPPARADFFFIQLSDPQLGFFEENRGFARESANLKKAVAHVNRLRPAFVVVTGDLINRPGDREQAAEYLRVIRDIHRSIPVHSVPGNHDVENVPTPASLAWFRSTFGPDRGAFSHGGSRFLFLNSGLLVDPRNCTGEGEEQARWLREELLAARKGGVRHIVLFQHHPWFVASPTERDDYHNVPLARRRPHLELLRETEVSATFAGHLHRCSTALDGRMEVVASGPVGKPLGNDPSGLRVVWVFPDRIEHRYYGLDQAPAQVGLAGPRERNRL